MKLDGINLFVLSARYLNISKAAREIHLSQSAASRQIKELERALGLQLFRKNGRGRELTESGQTFLDRVLPLRAQLNELEKSYSSGRDSIVVAASYRQSKYLLPELMTEFGKKYPTAKITLYTHSSIRIERLLLDSQVDLAVTTNPSVSLSAFVREAYFTEPLAAFVAADHRLAQMKSLRFEEAGTIPVILKSRREGESRTEALLRKLGKEGFKFRTVVRCDSPEVVKEFVGQGAGVGFLYYSSIKRGIERGHFKRLQFPGLNLVGENFIVYPKEKPLAALAKEFLLFLRAWVAKAAMVEPVARQRSNDRANGQMHNTRQGAKLLSWFIPMVAFDWASLLEWVT